MARIPQQKIDEILQAADLVSYVSRYVALKRTGKNLKGLCPFHKEKTPSFTISPEKQFFHCFGCNKGGNLFSFLMEIEKISYIEAVKKVASDLGIHLPRFEREKDQVIQSENEKFFQINERVKDFFKSELHDKQKTIRALEYLKKRNIKKETIKLFELGYAPNSWESLQRLSLPKKELEALGLVQQKETGSGSYDKFRNRLIFPFHNTTGRIVGFGGRALAEDQQPKYLNSPETVVYKKGSILYGLYQSADHIRKQQTAIVVEGYFDLLRLVDNGILNVVASSGTALSSTQAHLLKRYTKNVVIAYDSDEAGIKAALRNALILESVDLDVYIITIPKPHDPDSYILEHGKNAFLTLLNNKILPIEFRLLHFKSLPESESIEQKKSFADHILEDLSAIPNEVKIGLYIHRISEALQISESLLISRFNRLKQDRRGFGLNYENRETGQYKAEEIILRKGQWRAEETLLALLLENHTEVNRQILDQISTSDFVNKDYRDLFKQIATVWEDSGDIHLDDLKRDNRMLEQMLPRLNMIEINNPEKLAADCIYQIRKWSLDSRFNEIKRLINEESSSEKSVMHYMKELSAIRKKLTEIEHEHAKYLKTHL